MVALRPVCQEFGIPLHMTVHDELAFSIPNSTKGGRFAGRVKECMEDFKLEVPIRVDLATGENWGNTQALPSLPKVAA
jgi:DNA polymerase I-like protein with 3'-5' exonuclease and polymerase domains